MDKKKTSKKQKHSSMLEAKIVKLKHGLKITKNDAAVALRDPKFIGEAIYQALTDGDAAAFIEIIAAHVEAVNLTHLSEASGVALRTIHNTLSKGANPRLKTIAKLMHGAQEMLVHP